MRKHVYGPVPSRRLGRSLGVDPVPQKTCNFSCVYCQLGRTTNFTNERRDFFPREEIVKEVDEKVAEIRRKIDYITFVGDGEPTLCKSLGYLICKAKKNGIPVAVITNGALLYDEGVRKELSEADVVMPSLDAGSEVTFRKVNRPRKEMNFKRVIEGMIEFRKIYDSQIWMEYMAIKNVNDTPDELTKIKKILEKIKPDRVYINVPIRPPAESWVEGSGKIEEIASTFDAFRIVLPEQGGFYVKGKKEETIKRELQEIIERHPMREDQIQKILSEKHLPYDLIEELLREKQIKRVVYAGKKFYLSEKTRSE